MMQPDDDHTSRHHHIDLLVGADDRRADSPADAATETPSPTQSPRPWVGIRFECCGIYIRVYRDPDESHYNGCCPRCGRPVTLRVAPDGVSARIFRALPC